MASFKVGTLVSLASTATNAEGKILRRVAPRAQPSHGSVIRHEITAISKSFCEMAIKAVGRSRASSVVMPACLNVSYDFDNTERLGCTTSASFISELEAVAMTLSHNSSR